MKEKLLQLAGYPYNQMKQNNCLHITDQNRPEFQIAVPYILIKPFRKNCEKDVIFLSNRITV